MVLPLPWAWGGPQVVTDIPFQEVDPEIGSRASPPPHTHTFLSLFPFEPIFEKFTFYSTLLLCMHPYFLIGF